MNRKSMAGAIAPVLLLAVASCAAWAVGSGLKVVMDGATFSTDVRIISGSPYVPLSDVAKAMDMSVVKTGDTYRLVRTGGANQLPGITGKLDANITSRDWSLRVFSAEEVGGYSQQYGPEREPVALQQAGDVLIVVKCRIKNSTNETQEVYFDKSTAGNTTLTDDQEHGFTPTAFDTRNTDYSTNKMLPGSAHEFALVFSVPKGTRIKDLVYTAGATGLERKTDFRVALKP